jgi:hypothetical protein
MEVLGDCCRELGELALIDDEPPDRLAQLTYEAIAPSTRQAGIEAG